MEIKVMSLRDIIKYASEEHSKDSVVISIRDTKSCPTVIKQTEANNIKDVLFLNFDDVDEGSTAINKSDAIDIKFFVEKHKDASRLIVNCGAGQSRSAGVAGAIMKYLYNDDTKIFNDKRYTPNMKCYSTVLETLMNDTFTFYDAWQFLSNHPVFSELFTDCLYIKVVSVDPEIGMINTEDKDKNTKTEVWLRCWVYTRPMQAYKKLDYDLDCGGNTFEEAIITLAELVKANYGE